jgi:NADH:ubiquinone oxidoreductase subunit 5 (subunit L)/multisubunit Na+/H+ antiporter MnhA subunit
MDYLYNIFLAVSILVPFGIGLLLFFFGWAIEKPRFLRFLLVSLAFLTALAGQILMGIAINGGGKLPQSPLFTWAALPNFQVNLVFRADFLSFFFGLPLSIIGLVMAFYLWRRKPHPEKEDGIVAGRLYGLMLCAEGAALAVFYAQDLIFMFAWVQVLALAVYLLSGPGLRGANSEASSYQGFVVQSLGGWILLAPFLTIISRNGGSADYTLISPATLDSFLFALVMVACLIMAVQFPFQVWFGNFSQLPPAAFILVLVGAVLPVAMYLPARLLTLADNNNDLWAGASLWLVPIGALSVLTCGILALRVQTGLVQKIALIISGQFGFVVMALGIEQNYVAALTELLTITICGTLLFLVADQMQIEKMTPPNPQKKAIGNVIARPPYYRVGLLILYGVGCLGVIGLPLSPAYTARWYILNALLAPENRLYFGLVLLGIAFVTAALLQGLALFIIEPNRTEDKVRKVSWLPLFIPIILAIGQIALGLYPAVVGDWLAGYVLQVNALAPNRFPAMVYAPLGWFGILSVLGLLVILVIFLSKRKVKAIGAYNGGMLYGADLELAQKYRQSTRRDIVVQDDFFEGFEDEFFRTGSKVKTVSPPPSMSLPRLSKEDYFSSLTGMLGGLFKVADTGYSGKFYGSIGQRVLRFFVWIFEWTTERFYAALAALVVLVFIILLTR